MAENLDKKTLPELREIAKGLGIKSVTTYKKQQLCDLILETCTDVDVAPVKRKQAFQESTVSKKTESRQGNAGSKEGKGGAVEPAQPARHPAVVREEKPNNTREAIGVLEVLAD